MLTAIRLTAKVELKRMRSTLYPTKVTIILVSWACRFFWSRGLETTGSGSSRYRMSEHFWHPIAHVQKLQMTLAYVPLGWYSNRTGTSVDDGKAREKDWTRLPVPNLQLCYWSSQLFNLRAPSSFDVPVLLPNQPIIVPRAGRFFDKLSRMALGTRMR